MSNIKNIITKTLPKNQIIYKGECIDNNDPKRLGRIRAILKSEYSVARQEANDITEAEKWTSKDPFVFKPMLPWFISSPPKINEYVHFFFSNIDRKGSKDKYYIGGVFSHPTMSKLEPYDSANLETDEGSSNKDTIPLLDSDGKYKKNVEGVYGEPEDISIYGRGSSDIIIRENSVIIRAGKKQDTQPNNLPVVNPRRAFIQLSDFDTKTEFGNPQKKYKFNFEHKNIKKLIEYNLINPENTTNKFTGHIDIFHIDTPSVTTENMKVYTKIPSGLKQKQTVVNFRDLSMDNVIKVTKEVINGVIEGNLSSVTSLGVDGVVLLGEDNQFTKDTFDSFQVFPLYFRPNEVLYRFIKDIDGNSNFNVISNISNYMNGVTIKPDVTPGYSLVYDKESKRDTVPFKKQTEESIEKKIESFKKSVSFVGSDEIYLLSHNASKFGQQKIDISDSMLGISELQTADELEPKTSSLVRGEELQEFLNLVVNFLVSHVHSWHGTPPVPVSTDGTNVGDILKELQLSSQKILNKYIRIN